MLVLTIVRVHVVVAVVLCCLLLALLFLFLLGVVLWRRSGAECAEREQEKQPSNALLEEIVFRGEGPLVEGARTGLSRQPL